MAKTKKLVHIQLDIRVKLSHRGRLTRALMEEAVKIKARTGADPKGFKIKIVDWKHPGKNAVKPEDVGISQEEAWERFRGLLQAGRFGYKIRSSGKL